MTTEQWWCEGYGPPADGIDPDVWPECFLSEHRRLCVSAAACSGAMAIERRRVYRAINELAAQGDEDARMLAQEFTLPSQLLGGEQLDEDPPPPTDGVR